MIRFTLTAEHIKLLTRMYVGWDDCETGAPAIDPKRPYGNSDVPRDVAEILGWPDASSLSNEQRSRALELHGETQTALQIVLTTGTFEPGDYVKRESYNDRSWMRRKA